MPGCRGDNVTVTYGDAEKEPAPGDGSRRTDQLHFKAAMQLVSRLRPASEGSPARVAVMPNHFRGSGVAITANVESVGVPGCRALCWRSKASRQARVRQVCAVRDGGLKAGTDLPALGRRQQEAKAPQTSFPNEMVLQKDR
jgi:hypothetical protein